MGCTLTSILFLGGYVLNVVPLIYIIQQIDYTYIGNTDKLFALLSNHLVEGLLYSLSLGLKSCIMIFVFIWTRASFPRIRYDQLMTFCWTILLPIVIAFVVLVPCILYSFEIIPSNISLF